ncbi:ketosteroid isomerase-related protein [Mycolicibacterium gilvum]|uniref:SnoaL-like domain n=1 Tax=Mycolicibacterium gilvum TaxID=1804 RepID=A0A378SIU2_9MYCO|nr:ketosteroid isomerase-related protein [Mycolicibacterium gilvum]MCV7054309.1 nuclear transport factor 2 family protein [Mycolicibacterium gilvum]STZ42739.1 SnoaL-like domain [Mycolicibacterium gilvum]
MSLDTTLAAQHAARWANALTTDTDAAVDLYADDMVYDDHADSDHVIDTAITKDELRPRLAPFANTDPGNGVGVHTFTANEAFQLAGIDGDPAVVILWGWTGAGLDTFRGVPTGGKTLSTRGITWHQLDSNGKIARETTYWNDTSVLQELGLPIITPEYWVEGFDPAALAQ